MRYCRKCGKRIGTENFCPYCGSYVGRVQRFLVARKGRNLLPVLAGSLTILAVFCIWFFISSKSGEHENLPFGYFLPAERSLAERFRNATTVSSVRDEAVGIVSSGVPDGIDPNSVSWKIWKINYWVSENINYISDPRGFEYISPADVTLRVRGGDCDDFAVLIASLGEAVGIDFAIALVDVGGGGIPNHAAALAYYPNSRASFEKEVQSIELKMGESAPSPNLAFVCYSGSSLKYDTGMWVPVDPLVPHKNHHIGFVILPYKVLSAIDVGE